MAPPTSRRRASAVAAAFGATIAAGLVLAPSAQAQPAAAPEPMPPRSCGVMFHELGPLSAPIHEQLEPGLFALGLAGPVHGLNCAIVLNLEYLLGLQTRPWF